MPDILIEQALCASAESAGYSVLAHSPGFRSEWQTAAEALCIGFSRRTPAR